MASLAMRPGLALAALVAAGCFDAPSDGVAGGGGVETTEGNLASLTAAPAGARVSLIPADFDPLVDSLPDSLTALADANGVYRFRGLPPGRYNLEAHLPSEGTRCFRPGVVIAEGSRTIAGTDTLLAPGRLRIALDGARVGVLTQKGRTFRMDLAGLEADSGGILIDSLPAGLLPPILYVAAPDSAPRVWTDSVRIVAGEVASVNVKEEWAHSAVLTWDTALLTSDSVEGYPLLVRLTAPEFPFAEASPGGADLRFRTLDGELLPHAVERWDSAAGRAEIWVRLKAQPGAGPGTMRMDWGSPAAVYRSGPVFDSLSGSGAVWHLNEKTSGGQGQLADAGPFSLPTLAVDLVSDSQGVAGGAQRFNGLGAYASAADATPGPTPGHLHVSAWIMADTAGLVGGVLAGKPPITWTILSNWRESDSTGFILEYVHFYDQVVLTLGFGTNFERVVAALDAPPYGTWRHIGATYDGTEAILWWDGKPVNSLRVKGELPLPSREYLIGANGTANPRAAKEGFFRGRIDEVRVFRSIPGRAWIPWDFTTQLPGSVSIRFQKLR